MKTDRSFTWKRGLWGEILTRDYLSRLDPLIRRMGTPLGSLSLAAVASFLCGIILHPRAFVIVAAILTVIGLGLAWPWISLRGLRGCLHFARSRVREGEPVSAHLSVRNRFPWNAWGVVLDGDLTAATNSRERGTSDVGISCVAGWRTSELDWKVVPPCRGEYPLRTPLLITAFPFGLRHASCAVAVSSRLLVWPRTFPVGPLLESAGRTAEGYAPRDRPGSAGDVVGVRPYRRGDSLRRIHWAQTARYSQLVVCELQSHAVPYVQIVLDTHRDAHKGAGADGSREWAIRVAASFAEDWISQGAEVEVILQGRVVAARQGSVQARCSRVLDAFARIEHDDVLTLADLLDLPACRQFRGSFRLVVTTDLGVSRLAARAASRSDDLYVVLRARSFTTDRGDETPAPPSPAPWIWLDDPARIPQDVRRAWKEVPVV